ncbi:hypothetical protein CDCA_CDCA04G1270 [Cyanidium caldarium]|uniref:Guanine nucleotide-binding protein subunit beta-like protein n=1 Tax=Cyanidium caldarium TaxID=2771 RepID=A0AAV9IT19_CYACA|nr:hypothetical protein CDCA_CDCA04G1270 [Cyanidium caldarium]
MGDAAGAWKLQFALVESHKSPVYGVAFSRHRYGTAGRESSPATAPHASHTTSPDAAGVVTDTTPSRYHFALATCGGPGVRVYVASAASPATRELTLVASHHDASAKRGGYYACVWTQDEHNGDDLLCAAGESGQVRVIRVRSDHVVRTLVGHGGAVNHLCVHPSRPSWLLSAGQDESVRLWDVVTGHCFAMFCGHEGHRGEVLYCDWHASGERFLSCGMDGSVRIWRVTEAVQAAFAEQRAAHEGRQQKWWTTTAIANGFVNGGSKSSPRSRLRTALEQFPESRHQLVHGNYVDCAQWVGDLVLSKSIHHRLVLWQRGTDADGYLPSTSEHAVLVEYEYTGGDLWFMRFALNADRNTVAVGTQHGAIFVFRVDDVSGKPCAILTHPKATQPVRQLDFSPDGRMLLAVCDDCTVWRWDWSDGP